MAIRPYAAHGDAIFKHPTTRRMARQWMADTTAYIVSCRHDTLKYGFGAGI
jgi:hypothetical protein